VVSLEEPGRLTTIVVSGPGFFWDLDLKINNAGKPFLVTKITGLFRGYADYVIKKIVVDDNTKPSARVGRKAQGSPRDSRVAEIPDAR
jgi:hypothetical protein